MPSPDYWFNIRGCLEKYRDINTARNWLLRATTDLTDDQFAVLLQSVDGWLTESNSHHELAEELLLLLADFDRDGDAERRHQFADAKRREVAERKAKEAREEEDRVRAVARRAANAEYERAQRLRVQAEQEERAERERIAEQRRQIDERQRKQREEVRRQTEAKRADLLIEIQRLFRTNFVEVDSYYKRSCVDVLPIHEFEREKALFVKSWITENTPTKEGVTKSIPDDEQSAAIAALHGHIQVVARAGSGKTTTLVNRALFLIKHCRVPSHDILILAFNRKAALEVRRRLLTLIADAADAALSAEISRRVCDAGQQKYIDRDDIEASAVDLIAERLKIPLPHVMTFHALAYGLVHPEESLLYNSAEGESQELSRTFQKVIDDYLQKPAFRSKIRELMLAHFREDWDRIVEGRYDQSKEELLRFRRSLPRESIRGEYVKSYGEKVIADFLFEHDIQYKYERNHWWSGINYRPDFTIFKTDKSGVIIEYFGLKGDTDYDDMSERKRSYWKSKKEWELIEFSPSDIARSTGIDAFLDLVKARIEDHGIPCIRLPEDEIWHRIRDRAIDRFTSACVSFIGRCRKNSWSPLAIRERIQTYAPISPVERMFLALAHRLYDAYLSRLSATGEDDFDGLMQRAAEAVNSGATTFRRKSGAGNLASMRYLFIDEFQDFSDLFYRLLCAIRRKNPLVELFCVGDDWQSINGFAGSDLRFFNDFEEYVGESRRLYIPTNYRSSKEIVALGNALMTGLGRPAVSHKGTAGLVLVSDLNNFEPSLIEKQRHPGDIITPAISRLVRRALADGIDVVMLCRRNALPWFVNYQDQVDGEGRGLARYLDLVRSFLPTGLKERLSISTAHKYKGLEKPMVIVLDAVARSYPLIHPDWVFSRILGDSPEKIAAEERRLLYVALTRAVDTLVVITEGQSKSPFLEALEGRHPLRAINWDEYPPVRGQTTRLIVKIGNQERRGVAPTFAIKDCLKGSGYVWQHAGWPGWAKTFPAEGFRTDTLKSEVWAKSADGVDIRIFDDTEALVAQFLVDAGNWQCLMDTLDVFCA
ncbi:MAG: UvrD-helicase domain-containing protein [Candidatus Accumulibacter sp.]|jgi:DNA helicase-4|uniref:UvrD-helicase domain-containing protein n=1 Tax=Accumulibacter sp. TaxID=2053492 RepID=UPI0025868C7D|nr:UvrD-helicase domain-containing protein [Accumulibacter sp.]MBK8115337.1 UvrD-helicase domain-containing protein [Accumulibacter sp.]